MNRTFNTLTIALIPVAIAINVAIGYLVFSLRIPFLYLDSIGTVLVGMLAGPIAGLVTGALANVIMSLLPGFTFSIWYAIVAAIIGLLAGMFGRLGWSRRLGTWIIGALATATVCAIISALITAFVFGGSTGAATDLIVAFARSLGLGTVAASYIQSIVTELIDKPATYIVAFLIALALPLRLKVRFPNAENLPK